jgi:hypothetical protein
MGFDIQITFQKHERNIMITEAHISPYRSH